MDYSPPGIIIPGAAIISPGSSEELKPGSGGRERGAGRPEEEARLQLSAPELIQIISIGVCHRQVMQAETLESL